MEQVIMYVSSLVLGISAVGAFIAKSQSARKYISLASEVLGFVDSLLLAVNDKELSEEEIKKLASECKEIKEAYLLLKK